MKINLVVLAVPISVLILTIGFFLPVFSMIREERCSLAFSEVVESDLLEIRSADQMIGDHPETVEYLMKHPKQTLKNCMVFETDHPDDDRMELVLNLAAMAYEILTQEKLPDGKQTLDRIIQKNNPELHAELTAN